MKARHYSNTAILGAIIAALSASGAHAAVAPIDPVIVLPLPELYDAKNYPGAGCQAFDGDQEVDLNHVGKSSFIFQLFPLPPIRVGGTWNESNAPRKVTCPIVRDKIDNNNGTYGAAPGANVGVNVWVNNAGAANALTCTLNSNDQWGGSVAVSTANSPVGQQQLNLDVNLSVVNIGHYSLECTLPPNSSVFSYRVFEGVRTDYNN